ncbi:kinesin-like protein KIN-7C [Argentina anserina]|uniref:kinesin-like protein KIN-7C n=1 Tax=Argentina anserina TaxID=57926 RepID=UPI0021768534|nr:kinesin-like protein KIN-7C [Potentilla anserina]
MVAIGGQEPMQEPGNGERILVSVRLRPLSEKETARNDVSDWECINENTVIYRNNLSISERSMYPTVYTFDRVFSNDCSTRRVYEEGAKKVALSVASGINSSIFAYGQTSSGKTYTMSGITEYAVADIYDYIDKHEEREFVLKFSALEIYNESVRDLLSADTTPLRLLDDPERGTIVERLTEETLRDWNHFRELLAICEDQRQIGETSLNEASSRSHQILRLVIESSAREFLGYDKSSSLTAMVNFVDLAGSERASQTLSAGTRLKEGCHINRSLLTLGTVIRKLSKGRNGHIPYRDSKLTRILQSSLGGNARTAIICTLSPAHSHVEQSRNTLLFASCAKEVTTNAQVNVVMSDKTLVKHLQKELAKLENELKSSGTKIGPADSSTLLREKDLQIEKLKKEVSELTLQRDLAQSEVKDLVRVLEDDKPSSVDLDRYYPKLRVRNSWENIETQPSGIPILAGSHHRRGSVRSFGTSQYSDVDSRTSSEDTLPQRPDFDDNFLIPHVFSSSQLSVSNSIDANLHQEENKEQSDVNSEDVCKEVRCIEMEESNTNRFVPSNISYSSRSRYSNFSSPAANTATSGLTVVENGDGTNKSPLLNHKGFVIPSPEETSQWFPEKETPTPLIYKLRRSRSCKASLLTSFSSCLFEMGEKNEDTPLIEFEKSYDESTPPTEFEKKFVGRPKGLQKKLPSFKYDSEIERLSQNDSQASARTPPFDECKPYNTESTTNDKSIEASSLVEETKELTTTDDRTTESSSLVEDTRETTTTDDNEKTTERSYLVEETDDKITQSNYSVDGITEMMDTQSTTQLPDSMLSGTDTTPIPETLPETDARSTPETDLRLIPVDWPVQETGLRSIPSTREVKDVGLDPMPMDEENDSTWPSEFKRLQREIVELWHACNVSLVHRTYFFLLFKGDPSDSIYMEVELRRLSFLKGTFLKGDQAFEDGLTPASSLRALCSERHMLSKQMSKRLSKDERDNLYLKWGIGLNSKNRRLQLANRLWSDTNNMDHISDSANVVAKLVGSVEPEQAFKEMFGLRFTPRESTTRRRSYRWTESLKHLV